MSVITKTFEVDGTLTDMTSVKLSSYGGTYGVKRQDNDAVVVADGTSMTKTATGTYQYQFTDPADDLTYDYVLEVTYDDETYWIEGELTGPSSDSSITNTMLITESDLQAHPGMSGVSNARATTLIKQATAAIKKYLGRRYLVDSQSDVTLYLNGTGCRDLWMPDGPITAITSLYDDGLRNYTSGSITIDDDNLMVYGGYIQSSAIGDGEDFPTTIRLMGTVDGFSKGSMNIRFIGRLGYNDANSQYVLPYDMEEACKQLCAYYQTVASMPGIQSQRTQTYSWVAAPIPAGGMPDSVKSLLNPYRRIEVY